MGDVRIRYYIRRKAWPGSRETWGYWSPCLKRRNRKTGQMEPTLMAKLGFEHVSCGPDGPAAWAVAEGWNRRWLAALSAHRAGVPIEKNGATLDRDFPPGSLGEAFARYRRTNAWLKDKKPRTREDWWRGWAMIEPVFGDVDPSTVAFEDLDLWYGGDPENPDVKGLLGSVGVGEAYRAMKIWRALWNVAGSLKRDDGRFYCDRDRDPSLAIRRRTPRPRTAIWSEGEAVRLVKAAIRMRYHGLAAALAVAWDSMLSPVDVRTLTLAQIRGDADGPFFCVDRAKTGRSAIATLSRRAQRLLDHYMATLPPGLLPSAPIFYTRGGVPGPKGGRPRPPAPYTKDTLGDDFRAVRNVVFPGDSRKLMDFRRSGSVEALAGEVDPGSLAGKMANTIDQSRELQRTYLPHQAAVVRMADEARVRGRARLRQERKETEESNRRSTRVESRVREGH